jgi:hypothetical protein
MCINLNTEEQHQLLKLLQYYKHLFNGTLGEFHIDPFGLHLISKGVKLVHACPYTVPRAVEQQLPTKIARLVDIGVLEEDYASEWASPTFPKRMELLELFPISESHNSLLKLHPLRWKPFLRLRLQ